MIKRVTHAQLGSICYHSDKLKPSDNPYSPNQFLALICPYLDLFCCSYSKRTLALLYTNLCLGALTGKLTEVSSLWNAKLLYNFSSKGKLYWACKKVPKIECWRPFYVRISVHYGVCHSNRRFFSINSFVFQRKTQLNSTGHFLEPPDFLLQ